MTAVKKKRKKSENKKAAPEHQWKLTLAWHMAFKVRKSTGRRQKGNYDYSMETKFFGCFGFLWGCGLGILIDAEENSNLPLLYYKDVTHTVNFEVPLVAQLYSSLE